MTDKNSLKKVFQASIKSGVITGSLKFSNLYCSQFQIFVSAKEWTEEDDGVVYASVRTDGDDFFALDFRYDEKVKGEKHKSILYDFLKPLFKKKLGGDYMQAWSISRESIIVK